MSEFSTNSFVACTAELKSDWSQIVEINGLNPTLAPAWFSVIADSLAPAGCRMDLLLCRDSDAILSAVLPYFNSSRRMLGLRLSVLEPGSNLMSYHASVPSNIDAEDVLSALLARAGRWDVFHFANVPIDSLTADAIRRLASRAEQFLQIIEGDESPYLTINGTWESYLASRNKKFRYKHRQRREIVESNSDLSLRWMASPEQTNQLLEDMLAIERNSWKSAAGRSVTSREAELEYHRRLLAFLVRDGALLANVLYHSSRPIAYSLCCNFGGWIGHLKTSFDQDFASLSPGGYVIDVSVERAFDLNAREFDFLGGADPHKLAWTSATRRHVDFFLFARTWKGRVIAQVKRWRLRD